MSATPARVEPALKQSVFAARGIHETLLTVQNFGRFAITATSAQGTALQLVDRMAGPGDIEGAPGQQDGRIDAFLERGSYKVRIISDARGSGNVTLAAVAFKELQPTPQQLVENQPVLGSLEDREQISWWLIVSERGSYSFEAGGRYLADLRLWRDGSWIMGAMPQSVESDAIPSQPLVLEQLTAQLEPGIYRLTAYGGPGLPWATGGGQKPFLMRWGVPQLGDASRTTHTESVLGTDRFIVPSTATDLRLVIDHPEAAQISAQPYSADTMFQTDQAQIASISKTSRDPVADLPINGGPNLSPWLVTVTYKPGGKYRLECLNADGDTIPIGPGLGQELLATMLPGDPDDTIDPAFLLIDSDNKIMASSVINLDTALPWRRHFNLLGSEQTFLFTKKSIDLRIDGSGAKATFFVDRFLTGSPFNRVYPLPKPSGGVWTLTPGFYGLTAQPLPNGAGILTMSLYVNGTNPPSTDRLPLPAAIFPRITLDPLNAYTLYTSLNDPDRGTGETFGLSQVALPASLVQPLSLELGVGQVVDFPVFVGQNAQFSVTDGSPGSLTFTLGGKKLSGSVNLHPGTYQFSVTGPGPGNDVIEISETPVQAPQTVKLPAAGDAQPTSSILPEILPGQPDYVNLAQSQTITLALPVDHDALYRLETTGLLETGGTIQTRTNPSLTSVEGNGIGRNFLLQQYLREGDYQLSVQTQGATAGHTGILVAPTPVLNEGQLASNLPARMTLEPGQAGSYEFHIDTAGSYHIFTLGLGHPFAMRLEDADGWPLITPGGPADVTMDFAPGDYRMILLPGAVENRAVTMLAPIPPPVTYQGHGPFAVVFGQDLANRWMEPAPGQKRSPDIWKFALPASTTVTVAIDNGMRARIFGSGSPTSVANIGGNWTGKLPAGDYTIAAASAAPDNRLDYNLNVSLADLVAGQSEAVNAPQTIPISLGGGNVEISSFGDQDVRASLIDASGKIVAANDDRDNDWNFLISGSFPAGAYTLDVEPVGADNAQTTVSISAPATISGPVLAAGVPVRLDDGAVHVIALPKPPPNSLLLMGATSPVPVALALDASDHMGIWRQIAETAGVDPYLAMPAGPQNRIYRLRVWPEDHGITAIDVTAIVADPAGPAQADLAGGIRLLPVTLGSRQLGLRQFDPGRAGIFQIVSTADTLGWSTAPGVPVTHDPSGTIIASGALWLVDTAPGFVAARPIDLLHDIARLNLAAGQALSFPLPDASGPALWRAQGLGAQPGIAVVPDTGNTAIMLGLEGKTGLLNGAVAFQPAGIAHPVLRLWQAGGEADGLPLTVQRTAFPAPAKLVLAPGENDGVIGTQSALQGTLPSGWKRMSLNLPTGMAAIFLTDGLPKALVLGTGAMPDVLESDATSLLLLNQAGAAAFSLSLQTAASPTLILDQGGLLTHYSAKPVILHIAITNGQGARLRIAGSTDAISVIGPDGNVTTGDNAMATAGSVALVTMQPGLAIVSEDAVPGADAGATHIITGSGSIALTGTAMRVAAAAGQARLVTLETDTPIVLRNRSSGIPMLFPQGADISLFQPKGGPLDLDILAVGGSNLSGNARFAMTDATPISDGLGPKNLLGPGDSRLFSFSLTQPHAIGIGVRGTVDNASTRLLASDGTELGSGVVHMHNLPAGTYYLAVSVPVTQAASTIQPALVGLTLPDDGPPPDVQAAYRALAMPGDQNLSRNTP